MTFIGDGVDKTLLYANLPDNLGSSFAYNMYDVMKVEGDHIEISQISMIAHNARYTIHTDASSLDDANDHEIYIHDCFVKSIDNTGDAPNWSSLCCYGMGISDGMKITIKDSTFDGGWLLHDNVSFDRPYTLTLDNVKTITRKNFRYSNLTNMSSGVKGNIIIKNCDGDGAIVYNYSVYDPYPEDLSSIVLKGSGNTGLIGIQYQNIPKYQLRFNVSDTTAQHTIRFDTASSGFAKIKGVTNWENSVVEVVIENGYAYKDGGVGFKAWVMGLLPVYDSSTTKLSVRLGDCSTNNLILGLIVDGTALSITLDANYSSMTNDDILASLNTKLAALSIPCVADLYCIGAETAYPTEMDNVKVMKNLGSADITAGHIVKRSVAGFDLCTTDSEAFGVLLDDTKAGNVGRILRKGYITKYGAKYNILPMHTSTVGTRLGCDPNGILTDAAVAGGKFLHITSSELFFDLT